MTREAEAGAIPGVCATCAASPAHIVNDTTGGTTVYCAHREVLVDRRGADKPWRVFREKMSIRDFRRAVRRVKRLAGYMAERGIAYSPDQGFFRRED